jgi:hypothetical protein
MSWLQDVDDKFDKLKVGTHAWQLSVVGMRAWQLLSVVVLTQVLMGPRLVLDLI